MWSTVNRVVERKSDHTLLAPIITSSPLVREVQNLFNFSEFKEKIHKQLFVCNTLKYYKVHAINLFSKFFFLIYNIFQNWKLAFFLKHHPHTICLTIILFTCSYEHAYKGGAKGVFMEFIPPPPPPPPSPYTHTPTEILQT